MTLFRSEPSEHEVIKVGLDPIGLMSLLEEGIGH